MMRQVCPDSLDGGLWSFFHVAVALCKFADQRINLGFELLGLLSSVLPDCRALCRSKNAATQFLHPYVH